MIMASIVGAIILTIVTIFEPISPAIVISALGFLATITISLFGLLRTEQQNADRKDQIKRSLLELVEEVGQVEGMTIESHSREGLRSGLGFLVRKMMEYAGEPTTTHHPDS